MDECRRPIAFVYSFLAGGYMHNPESMELGWIRLTIVRICSICLVSVLEVCKPQAGV